ncbi:MAG: hypothetical protein NT009_00010 [Proteobacteria bacterium]|nr:hypothetical protein [Pseudomonadota bacterium]
MNRALELKSLPVLVGELIRRMNNQERLELSRHLSWEELEEWKATAEVLADKELVSNIRKGLKDEKEGKFKSAEGFI